MQAQLSMYLSLWPKILAEYKNSILSPFEVCLHNFPLSVKLKRSERRCNQPNLLNPLKQLRVHTLFWTFQKFQKHLFSIFVYSRIDINICLFQPTIMYDILDKRTHFSHFSENRDFLEIYLSLFHLFCSKHISLFSNSLWFADFSRIQTSIS